ELPKLKEAPLLHALMTQYAQTLLLPNAYTWSDTRIDAQARALHAFSQGSVNMRDVLACLQ
ncbi:MAG: hypothetical protein RR482_02810, partial [Clostridia bacterium]